MDYLLVEILFPVIAAFVIGLVAGRLLRALGPARGAVGDRAAMAERLAAERETESRHMRGEVASMTERVRKAEAEAAAAQAEVARAGVHLSTTRTDFSRKILALEEEIVALKRPRPVVVPRSEEPAPVSPSVAAAPAPVAVAASSAPVAALTPIVSVTSTVPIPPEPIPSAAAAPSVSPLASLPPDDLKEIVGIGPILEHTLQSLGLKSFAQIAMITPEDVAMLIVKVDSSIAERVLRERWVEQARDLYAKKYGQAA